MKIDYGYLKLDIFPKFLESKSAYILIDHNDFQDDAEEGINPLEKLAFHWYMLCDQGMIINAKNEPAHGVFGASTQGKVSRFIPAPVRLTFTGQEFAQNLTSASPPWIEKVKNFGVGTAAEILKNVAVSYGTTSIQEIINY